MMSRPHFGLPLLTKELLEQSARPRTYVVRFVYATALYGLTLAAFWGQLGSWSNNSFAMSGMGRQLFTALAYLQFAGLYLFLPAMTCGVLAGEKERETLGLLLLTKLGPWTIVLEKLLGRLVPMSSFVLLSMPLLAVAYSLGGVEESEIGGLAWSLSVTAFQVGSLSLACSAWCRTTSSAFLSSYLIGAALNGIPPLLLNLDETGLTYAAYQLGQQMQMFAHVDDFYWMFFGPQQALDSVTQGMPFSVLVIRTFPMLVSTGACLLFARMVLWRRAFLSPSNYLLKAFKLLDAAFHKANQNRFTQGIVLTNEHVELPLHDPIGWRETKKRSTGTTRYLVRFLILLEIPVVIAMRLSMFGHESGRGLPPVYIAAWALWIVAALALTVQSTGLIGLERSRQTLDVLLTTTQSSEAIVRNKFAGVWRMIRMLWVPFATVYFFQIYCVAFIDIHSNSYAFRGASLAFAILRALLAVAIYPLLIAWIGFHQGLRQRSQTRATLMTLGMLTGVCLIPVLLAELALPDIPLGMGWGYGQGGNWSPWVVFLYGLSWISPAHVLGSLNPIDPSPKWVFHTGNSEAPAWLGLLMHFTLAGLLLVYLWKRGMTDFARHVNRNDGLILDDDDIDRLASLRQQIVGGGVFRKTTED